MLKICEEIYTGTSTDAADADLKAHGITALLNVAHDLQGKRGWTDGLVYAQCGMQDGPGTEPAVYHAAALMLVALTRSGKKVLVYDHDGGRALAVAIFWLQLQGRRSWDEWLGILRERLDGLKEPHAAHKKAFEKVNWRLLGSVLEG